MHTHGDSTELQLKGSLTKRWIIYLVGIYILTLGISLAIRAGIGISPQSSLTRTLTVIYPNLTQGTYSFMLELLMLLLAFLVMPKAFQLKYFAGLIPALALSLFLDLNLLLTGFIQLDLYAAKVMLLIVADAALAFGLFLMLQANLVLIPVDLFVNTLFQKTGWKWGNIKTAFDCSLLVASACIGLLFLGEIKFIREGTIINAILVGQYIKLYTHLYKKSQAGKAPQNPNVIKN
ncbi:YczE/YyaS/YitT family protein [Brevibacillus parabrevis]|uniref:YczE/YyaS/YitT family protein n=1 Tax=Brevibacillus parabrevis TaxID=54914 RepID=UPI0007AB9266|nr:DUF6198 family protein [Brevibacillus parabrevis]KZE50415.1 hypothetical protein AV540_13265 [Brevibacillus parabrevis]MED1721937.1 DUF6198 family protein [Brevibacillus parabrevis]WDV96800.1 DUF6198 family protein [Brevibacillus parabrevis]